MLANQAKRWVVVLQLFRPDDASAAGRVLIVSALFVLDLWMLIELLIKS